MLRASVPLDVKQMEQADTDCRSLLEDAPDNASGQLRTRLSDRMKSVADAAVKARREAAIRQAQEAIQGKGDPSTAWSNLEQYEPNEAIKTLRRQLRVKTIEKTTDDRLVVLRSSLGRAATLGNERLRRLTVSRVYDGATSVLLDLEIEEPRSEAAIAKVRVVIEVCEKEFKELGQRSRMSRRGRSGSTRHGRSTRSNSLRSRLDGATTSWSPGWGGN